MQKKKNCIKITVKKKKIFYQNMKREINSVQDNSEHQVICLFNIVYCFLKIKNF